MDFGTGERWELPGEAPRLSQRALICLFRRGFVEDYTGAGREPMRQRDVWGLRLSPCPRSRNAGCCVDGAGGEQEGTQLRALEKSQGSTTGC